MQYGPHFNHPTFNYSANHSYYQQPLINQQPNFPYHQQQQQYSSYSNSTPFQQFAKPKQPVDWFNAMNQNQQSYQQPYQSPSPGILTQFQDENGQLNLDKMLTTVGQLANTYHQVQPIIKQFSFLMKNYRE